MIIDPKDTKKTSPGKTRQASLRERRKAGGLVRFEVWVTPEQRTRIRVMLAEEYAQHLTP